MTNSATALLFWLTVAWMPESAIAETVEERNRAIAAAYYEDLWFNNRTDRYTEYMADTYLAHDIGDRKNVLEPAIEQKRTADRLWAGGRISGEIQYQIAEGDLVATRLEWRYEPRTLMARLLFGNAAIPVINVFRFDEDGKIVELWNHRHDIDTNITILYSLKGFAFGLLIALLVGAYAAVLRRRVRRLEAG